MSTDRIWSLREASKQLSIGKTKIHELIKRGEIRTFEWQTRRYIRDDDLRAFIARISGQP